MSVKSDSRHLYLRVIDHIKEKIKDGAYKERQKLPSEFDLAKELGVSRATLREASRYFRRRKCCHSQTWCRNICKCKAVIFFWD